MPNILIVSKNSAEYRKLIEEANLPGAVLMEPYAYRDCLSTAWI